MSPFTEEECTRILRMVFTGRWPGEHGLSAESFARGTMARGTMARETLTR